MPALGSVTNPPVTGVGEPVFGDFIANTMVDYKFKLTTDIQSRVENDYPDLADCLDNLIRQAEKRIWSDTEGVVGFRRVVSGTLIPEVIQQPIYPAEYGAVIMSLKVLWTGQEKGLLTKDESFIYDTGSQLPSGFPLYYCPTADGSGTPQILVSPKPAGPYTYEVEYSLLTSVVDFPTSAWLARVAYNVLLHAALIEVYLFLKYPAEELNKARADYDRALRRFALQQGRKMRTTTYQITETRNA